MTFLNPPIGMRFINRPQLGSWVSEWIVTHGVYIDVFGSPYILASQTAKRGIRGRFRNRAIWHLKDIPKP